MAAGDLIDAYTGPSVYLVEYEGVLFGDEDPWMFDDFVFGATSTPGNVAPLAHTAGFASGGHVSTPSGVVFTARSVGCIDPEEAEEALAEVTDAMTLATVTVTPKTLHLLMPFHGHVSVKVWPGQMDPTRTLIREGIATVVCGWQRVDNVITTHGGS